MNNYTKTYRHYRAEEKKLNRAMWLTDIECFLIVLTVAVIMVHLLM